MPTGSWREHSRVRGNHAWWGLEVFRRILSRPAYGHVVPVVWKDELARFAPPCHRALHSRGATWLRWQGPNAVFERGSREVDHPVRKLVLVSCRPEVPLRLEVGVREFTLANLASPAPLSGPIPPLDVHPASIGHVHRPHNGRVVLFDVRIVLGKGLGPTPTDPAQFRAEVVGCQYLHFRISTLI